MTRQQLIAKILEATDRSWTPPTLQELAALIRPTRPTVVADIGALLGTPPPYQALLQAGLCHLIGFEPQADGLARLIAQQGPRETYLPYVVGDGTKQTLHCCRSPYMTSLLRPDRSLLRWFRNHGSGSEVVATQEVQTHRLDDLSRVPALDWMKVDAQGSELAIFRHGAHKLQAASVIHTEVALVPLYEGQPRFGEIDAELRRQGFVFHRWVGDGGTPWFLPMGTPLGAGHQVLDMDALYVRDWMKLDQLPEEQLRQYALIMCAYGSHDLAHRCLEEIDRRCGTAEAPVFRARVENPAILQAEWLLTLPADQVAAAITQLEPLEP